MTSNKATDSSDFGSLLDELVGVLGDRVSVDATVREEHGHDTSSHDGR